MADDSDDGSGEETPVSRRTALKAGGLLALLGIGAGTASADPQGQVGKSSDPLTELYTEELNGGVTGDTALNDLTGTGLAIDAGALGIDSGGVTASELATPFADLATLVGSPVAAGGTIDLGGNDITGGTGSDVTITTDGGTRALELGVPETDSGGNTAGGNVVAGHPNNTVNGNAVGAVLAGGGRDGGDENTAGGNYTTIGGGIDNTASGLAATIGGGQSNTASGVSATVAGGFLNTASGGGATVGGGAINTAGGNVSFAVGNRATASHDGAVVFADSSETEIQSQGPDEFRSQQPMYAPSFNTTSARAAKTAVEPVDPRTVLDRVETLEVNTWEFEHDADGRHVGPMAGAFHDAFGLGGDTDSIATVDADGVALAAIQGLSEKLDERDDRIDDLETTLERTRQRLRRLEATTGAGGPIDSEEGADV